MTANECRPLRVDAERNRRRILDAARVLFAEQGFEVGVEMIAREAEVGVGTIYRRFPTKEDLLQAILDDRVEVMCANFAQASAASDPWEAFSDCVVTVADGIATDQGFYHLLQTAPAAQRAFPVRVRVTILEMLAPVVARAQQAEVLREDIVPSDVFILCATAAKMPLWIREHQPQLWRRYLAIIFDGLRPEAAHPLVHPPADDSTIMGRTAKES